MILLKLYIKIVFIKNIYVNILQNI